MKTLSYNPDEQSHRDYPETATFENVTYNRCGWNDDVGEIYYTKQKP